MKKGIFHDGIGLTGLGLTIYLVFWGTVCGVILYAFLPLADQISQHTAPIIHNYWAERL